MSILYSRLLYWVHLSRQEVAVLAVVVKRTSNCYFRFSHFEYYVKNATGRDKFEEWRVVVESMLGRRFIVRQTNKDKRLSSLQKIALRSQNGEMV